MDKYNIWNCECVRKIQTIENIIKEYKASEENMTYVLNVNTHKFHKPTCSSVKLMKDANKIETNESRDVLINKGYSPCKNCNP